MDKIIKALIGLIFAFIALVGIFGILPQLGLESPFANFQNPLAGLFEQGKNAAANAALDATGLKSKAKAALEGNRDKIAAATGMSDAEVDAAIAAARKYGAVGVQVAVVEDGAVTGVFNYGWAHKGNTVMEADHKIRCASISKVFVGMTAMLLREDGLLDLDGDISPYWGVTARNPRYPEIPITFRSLMSHTSSIRVFGDGVSRSYSAVRSKLGSSAGYSSVMPGAITSWNYNNYAFGVLGMTLELAADRYLDDILDEKLFSAMEIDAGVHRIHELPPRFDFFRKHESQYK